MSKSNEFEKLQTKKADLETESRSLKEEQKNMEERILILEEKIAIEELNNTNKATRDAIAQLNVKINGLEAKLKQTSQTPEPAAPVKEPEPVTADAPKEETFETAEPAPEGFEEDAVTVTAIEEESLVANQEDLGENLKAQQEKKKRKFF
jgi:uncharacterized coiled-coil protein SlyX